MTPYSAHQLSPFLHPHGRTWFDPSIGALWFNWTCSGFTITFTGKTLRAKILAIGDGKESDGPVAYPCLGVADENGEASPSAFAAPAAPCGTPSSRGRREPTPCG